MTADYNREADLKRRLNTFLEAELGLPALDYYAKLNLDGFLGLKSVLSDINNIFTVKVCLAFVEWVAGHLALSNREKDQMKSQVLHTKPNANGYDIEVSEPVRLIAEIKCNLPINGGSLYGAAQRKGIEKDIKGLLNGKSKSSISPANYLKFMVLLDLPEIRAATEQLLKNNKKGDERIVFLGNHVRAKHTNVVYVVYVGF